MRSASEIGLFTDYYELMMAQGFFFEGNPQCEFYAFYRNCLEGSSFSVLSGVSQLLDDIRHFRFSEEDIRYLYGLKVFSREFLSYLESFSFKGDIISFAEGDVVFPYEPVLKVRGSFCECALLETFVLNCLNFTSCVATKAARISESAKGRKVFEFAMRRAPFLESANAASFSAFVGGCHATSNTLAGRLYSIPVFGTMAHSWVMGFENEYDAFMRFYRLYPDNCTFLIDTYDTLKSGICNAMRVGEVMRKEQGKSFNIRIDSGDLAYLAKECRKTLDENGFADSRICLSNDLDEHIISQLLHEGAPADSFGVGTSLASRSSLGFVYKLCRIFKDGVPANRMKISSSKQKATLPGSVQVHRFYDKQGFMCADMIESEGVLISKRSYRLHHPVKDENLVLSDFGSVEQKLSIRMRAGEILEPTPSASESRTFCRDSLERLHPSHKRLLNPHIYKVSLADGVKGERDRILSSFQPG